MYKYALCNLPKTEPLCILHKNEKNEKIFQKPLDKAKEKCYYCIIKREENNTMEKIVNLPAYATEYRYIVATESDGDFWFYGAYSDGRKAEQVALSIGGEIFFNF